MKVNEFRPLNIKSWSPEDRPREKLLLKGTSALSDAELIAILLGSGTTTMSAVELARRILQGVNNSLHDLARLSVKDLMKIRGIGEAKAITIIAALELGRRRKELEPNEKPRIIESVDAYELLKSHLQDLPREEFWVMLLNRGNRVIRKNQVSLGGVGGTVADPKIIFKMAVEELASGIVLAHNHPSGSPEPSQSDIALTKKFQEGGKLLDIQVVDHIIIADTRYFSFADEGML
jgi:DNA repair protein RadC